MANILSIVGNVPGLKQVMLLAGLMDGGGTLNTQVVQYDFQGPSASDAVGYVNAIKETNQEEISEILAELRQASAENGTPPSRAAALTQLAAPPVGPAVYEQIASEGNYLVYRPLPPELQGKGFESAHTPQTGVKPLANQEKSIA